MKAILVSLLLILGLSNTVFAGRQRPTPGCPSTKAGLKSKIDDCKACTTCDRSSCSPTMRAMRMPSRNDQVINEDQELKDKVKELEEKVAELQQQLLACSVALNG